MSSESTFSGDGLWLFAILALLGFGGNGFGGGMFGRGYDMGYYGARGGEQFATTADVQRATDFAALERQNGEIMQNNAAIGQAITTAVKDGNYNTLTEIRDIEGILRDGFANDQKCCCETLRAIDGVKFEGAVNTAAINANTTAQTQRILDAMAENRMADMQAKINKLEMRDALAGVVRYPMASTYNAGNNPFCGCNNGCYGNM